MANQRLNATVTIGGALNKSVGRAIGGLRGGLEGVASEIREVTDRQRELSKQRKVLEREGRSVEALDREYEELGRTLDGLRRKQERYERVAVASARVGEEFRSTVGEVGRVARNAGIALGAVGAAVFGVASSTAAAARDVQLASEVANAGTTEFQRLAAAAETVGIEQDKLGDILKDVNDRIGDFVETGGGPMADFFENIGPKVGVTAKHFKGLSGPEALQLYISSLEKANLSQAQMTFYLEAMASDATALIPLLRNNGAEARRLGDEAERMGRILDADTIEASARFRAELQRLTGGFTGLRNIIGTAVMPVVSDSMSRISDYLVENREEVDAFATAFADRLGAAVPIAAELASGLGWVATQVGAVTAKVAEMVGGWENFGIIVGTALGAKVAFRIGALVFSVGRLGAAVLGLVGVTAMAGRAFGALRQTITTEVNASAAAAEAAGARMRRALNIRGALLAANLGIAALQIPDTPEEVGSMIERNRRATEEGLRNTPIIGGAMRAYEGARDWWHGDEGEAAPLAAEPPAPAFAPTPPAPVRPASRPAPGRPVSRPETELQQRAVGGNFRPGWTLTGEKGPELKFENRSGFVATARETKRIADLAQRADAASPVTRPARNEPRPAATPGEVLARAIAGLPRALDAFTARARDVVSSVASGLPELAAPVAQPARAEPRPAAAPVNVTQNIHIDAKGMSVQQLVDEFERRRRNATNGGLYDGVHDFGQYGGALA
ncbi:hypothetical protein T8T21_05565 [Limimaricola variabilis]|uniref:hypothetical protein n=1 Tax=Limimaricola variabilis TaxID=1492771 RepID=UPI002AC8B48F|nr:hypothetical protein [Limimaricola variabilis]WPY95590.1 hypothetical protein T8T21_05565 [Limimaricola variabilis]